MILDWLTSLSLTQWILPVGLAAAGVALGILAETVLLARLRRLVDRTRWRWDDLLVTSLRGMVFVWLAAAGLYGASLAVELSEEVSSLVSKLLNLAVIFSVTVVAARMAAHGVRIWSRQAEGGIPSTSLLQNVARIVVFVLGAFLIVENLGYDITALLTGLGIGGLAVALALQDTLSNLFSGFQIILARQVRSGDYVRLDTGEEGVITDIQWRNTTIRSREDNQEVIVPNSKLAGAIVTNFDRPAKPYWLRVEVGVSYDSDLERVESVTLDVAREVLDDRVSGEAEEPLLRYREFGGSSINFVVRMRLPSYVDQYAVRHAFVKRLHARYREAGIEIPFPIRTVYAPKGVEVRGGGAPAAAPAETGGGSSGGEASSGGSVPSGPDELPEEGQGG